MPGALMRRWSRGIYADHTTRTRREESPRPFSGSATLNVAEDGSAARGVLQGPPPLSTGAVQARRGARRPTTTDDHLKNWRIARSS
jgi:hypothetical protein